MRCPIGPPYSVQALARNATARYLGSVMATKKTSNKVALRKANKPAESKGASTGKRAEVQRLRQIDDPVQRVLARAVPRLCDVFGFPPERLTVRGASANPVEYVQNSLREVALGSVVWLGRELGLAWSGLHHRDDEYGKTQIPELVGAHRYSLGLFATRFGALTGLGDDPDTGKPFASPVGQVGVFVRQAYEVVRADAMQEMIRTTLAVPA